MLTPSSGVSSTATFCDADAARPWRPLAGHAKRALGVATTTLILAAPAFADARVVLQPASGSSSEEAIALLRGIGAEVLAAVTTASGPFVLAHVDEPHIGLLRQSPVIDPFFRIDVTCRGWAAPCTVHPVALVLRVEEPSVEAVVASLDLLGGEISQQDPPFFEARVPVTTLLPLSEELERIENASLQSVRELIASGPSGCGGPTCNPPLEQVAVAEGRRFAVNAWTLPVSSDSGGLELGVDSAGFYFFSPGNLEVLVKVLDGCTLNGYWWVFAAGLTDQFVHIEIADRQAGMAGHPTSRNYESHQGEPFRPILDLEAFPCES